MTSVVFTFRELPPEQQPLAGGKGGTLARLYQAGYPIPKGFVLLPAAFAGDRLTEEAWAQVQRHLSDLRRAQNRMAAFAVRSSALSEDSSQASFAGEFESRLVNCPTWNFDDRTASREMVGNVLRFQLLHDSCAVLRS